MLPPAAEDWARPASSSVRLKASSNAAVELFMCASHSACRTDALHSILSLSTSVPTAPKPSCSSLGFLCASPRAWSTWSPIPVPRRLRTWPDTSHVKPHPRAVAPVDCAPHWWCVTKERSILSSPSRSVNPPLLGWSHSGESLCWTWAWPPWVPPNASPGHRSSPLRCGPPSMRPLSSFLTFILLCPCKRSKIVSTKLPPRLLARRQLESTNHLLEKNLHAWHYTLSLSHPLLWATLLRPSASFLAGFHNHVCAMKPPTSNYSLILLHSSLVTLPFSPSTVHPLAFLSGTLPSSSLRTLFKKSSMFFCVQLFCLVSVHQLWLQAATCVARTLSAPHEGLSMWSTLLNMSCPPDALCPIFSTYVWNPSPTAALGPHISLAFSF